MSISCPYVQLHLWASLLSGRAFIIRPTSGATGAVGHWWMTAGSWKAHPGGLETLVLVVSIWVG